MKRMMLFRITILSVVFALSLTGCGNNNLEVQSPETTESRNNQDEKSDENIAKPESTEIADEKSEKSELTDKTDEERFIGTWKYDYDENGLCEYITLTENDGYELCGYTDNEISLDPIKWELNDGKLIFYYDEGSWTSTLPYEFIDDNKFLIPDENRRTFSRISNDQIDLNTLIPEPRIYEKSDRWKNVNSLDAAVQIDDMFFSSGITVEEAMKIVGESSNTYDSNYEPNYNPNKIVVANDYGSFAVSKNGYKEYFIIHYYNWFDDTRTLAELPVVFVEPCHWALRNTIVLNQRYTDIGNMNYTDAKKTISQFFEGQTFSDEYITNGEWIIEELDSYYALHPEDVKEEAIELLIRSKQNFVPLNGLENLGVKLQYQFYFDPDSGELLDLQVVAPTVVF